MDENRRSLPPGVAATRSLMLLSWAAQGKTGILSGTFPRTGVLLGVLTGDEAPCPRAGLSHLGDRGAAWTPLANAGSGAEHVWGPPRGPGDARARCLSGNHTSESSLLGLHSQCL